MSIKERTEITANMISSFSVAPEDAQLLLVVSLAFSRMLSVVQQNISDGQILPGTVSQLAERWFSQEVVARTFFDLNQLQVGEQVVDLAELAEDQELPRRIRFEDLQQWVSENGRRYGYPPSRP